MPRLPLLLLAASTLAAQQLPPDELRARSRPYLPPPTAPTIRTEVNLVEAPVVVRDGKHHAVPGLNQDDFEIYDQGKKQPITSFTVETFDGNTRPADHLPAGAPAPPAAGSTAAAPARPRFIVLAIDNLSISFAQLKYTRDAAERFVRTSLAPGDRVAIVTTASTTTTTFTADVDQLTASLAKVTPQPRYADDPAGCPHITAYQAYVIVNNLDRQTFDGAVDEDMNCKHLQRTSAAEDVMSISRAVWEHARSNSFNTLASLRSMVDVLGKMPGRRMLLLASSGFLSGNLEIEEDELIARAIRAGVVINALDAKGLYAYAPGRSIEAPPSRGSMRTVIAETSIQSRQMQAKDDALAVLSAGTGGAFYHNSNDLDKGFKELGALPEVVYVLGFSPVDSAADGRFHNLKVKLVRGRYSVQSRLGYTAAAPAGTAPPTPVRAPSKLDAAVTSSDSATAFPCTTAFEAMPPEAGALPRLLVVVNVDLSRLPFDTRTGRRVQKLSVVAAFLDSSRNFAAGIQGEVELSLKPESFDRLVQEGGLNLRIPLQAAPGAYTLRTVVFESIEGQVTASSTPVELR